MLSTTATPADVDPLDRVLDARARLAAATAGTNAAADLRGGPPAPTYAPPAPTCSRPSSTWPPRPAPTPTQQAAPSPSCARRPPDGDDTAANKLPQAANTVAFATDRVHFTARAVEVATITAEALELGTDHDALRMGLEGTHTATHLEERRTQILKDVRRYFAESTERYTVIREAQAMILRVGFPGDSRAGQFDHLPIAACAGACGDVEVCLDDTVHRSHAVGGAGISLANDVAHLAGN